MSASPTPRRPGTTTPKTSISENNSTVNGSPSRSHTRSPSAAANGLSRSPSGRNSNTPVSARAAARKPARSNLSMSNVPNINNDPSEEEARAQNAALIGDLKEQLQKAETASEQYRKQLGVLQMRLDETVSDHGKLEDHSHERESKIEALNGEIREHVRQIRDLEQSHEMERNAMLQEKEQQSSREEEMQAAIQRLKDSLSQKDMRFNAENDKNMSRSCKKFAYICGLLIGTLMFLQPVSGTARHQMLMDSLRHLPSWSEAPRGTTPSCSCRKTS